jgi:hypothetical protein
MILGNDQPFLRRCAVEIDIRVDRENDRTMIKSSGIEPMPDNGRYQN